MRLLSSVVWSEGMYLAPHHFQTQNRYFEDSLQFATTTLWYQPYGILGFALDEDALRNGTVSLQHARGIFSDGMAFLMPDCDPLPPALPIADRFPAVRDRLSVSLSIPQRNPQGPNFALSAASNSVRYSAVTRTFRDETTGTDERPVKLGQKNIRLVLETESHDGLLSLPLARIMRDGSGHFVLDPDFIPPVLEISASERLMLLLRRLIEKLEAKSSTMGGPAGISREIGEFTPRDISNFWLLHAVNSALAPLRHQWISKRSHPEELFRELSRLAGALCTFALDSHPRTLPLYDHEQLSDCFAALDQHIRTHLETIVPTNFISIPLQQVRNYFFEGDIPDDRCFGRSRWLLGIHSNVGDAEVITKTPQLVKICSAKFVAELVRRAMAGLTLTHLPVPPSAIPAKLETHYFGIAKAGPFWANIAQTRRVGIYVPGDLPAPEVELLVILES